MKNKIIDCPSCGTLLHISFVNDGCVCKCCGFKLNKEYTKPIYEIIKELEIAIYEAIQLTLVDIYRK